MAPPTGKHSVKEVDFLACRVPVVMQAAGGASPLLAVGACPVGVGAASARAAPLRRCSTALRAAAALAPPRNAAGARCLRRAAAWLR
jgi:hypothetical protein